jgi:hypothetical protein
VPNRSFAVFNETSDFVNTFFAGSQNQTPLAKQDHFSAEDFLNTVAFYEPRPYKRQIYMFVTAIAKASEFVKPISFITRFYDSTDVHPGSGTLFFVNADGWVLTCRHILDAVLSGDQIAARRAAFEAEVAAMKGKRSRSAVWQIARKHHFNSQPLLEQLCRFEGCVDTFTSLDWHRHDKYDVALIRFIGYSKLFCSQFPVFAANSGDLQPGKMLCRLGFPFPEFSDFRYDHAKEAINWTNNGGNFPRFPIDGMVSRLVNDGITVSEFELTTPGLRGQSGGPAFDTDGRVWGMQSNTCHLDLNFDIAQDVFREGKKKTVTSFPFLHVGRCVHLDVLKAFMQKHGVSFAEG